MDDANPMGPLAGVKPGELATIVPYIHSDVAYIVFPPIDGRPNMRVTYAQLAAWASAQAQRCERVYPTEIVQRKNNNLFEAQFTDPHGDGKPGYWRGNLTREQAAALLRDGLPRHEVFPDAR